MDLGKAIKTCRVQKDLTQSDLAKKSDLSVSYLSLLEKGKRTPNLTIIEKIAGALKVPISLLVFLAFEPQEMDELSPDLKEKLSFEVLKMIKAS